MLVQFQIIYKTHLGQEMVLVGSIPELGENVLANAPKMTLLDPISGLWAYTAELDAMSGFTYRYYVKDDNFNTFIDEWGADRVCKPANLQKRSKLLLNRWRAKSDPDYTLHSAAFINAILKQGQIFKSPTVKSVEPVNAVVVRFKPNVIRIKPAHKVAICGSAKSLGAWNEKKAVSLGNPNFPEWSGDVKISLSEFPVRYKYLIRDEAGNTAFWEKAEDRVLSLPEGDVPDVIEIGDEKFDFPHYPWKGAGIAIPVFSLRRRQGFGVGEFTDIKLLVDWASMMGMRLIQILPINDTIAKHAWQDSYPYAAISVYALHPIYINLLQIGELESDINQQIIEAQGKYLNSLSKIDYEAVMALKSRFFKLIYDQKKQEFLNDPAFLSFFNDNEYWLRPYAAFSFLRDLFNTPDFSRWGEYSKPSPELLRQLTDKGLYHYDDIAVHYFIQYHAHLQLLDASNYARSKGVVLKGDIPIGIYRSSVDEPATAAWHVNSAELWD